MLNLSHHCCLWLALLCTAVLGFSDYHERLTLQPLPLGSLLASFDFRNNESLSAFEQQNFRFFPRSLGQILQHANTKELHLRFTTGRWDATEWGSRPWNGTKEGGTGVELWAWIDARNEEEAFERWTSLTQLLSGLFCASLNFVDSTRTTQPIVTFEPKGSHMQKQEDLHLLHGVLPGEVVCTENLTPFLKLLPCKGKAGISSLLDGHKVFDAAWQSMAIDVRPVCPSDRTECLVEMQQTIDMVLDIERSKRPRDDPIPRPIPSEQMECNTSKPYHGHYDCYPLPVSSNIPWSVQELFGRSIMGSCPLVEDDGTEAKPVCLTIPHDRKVSISSGATEERSTTSDIEYRCYHLLPVEEFDLSFPKEDREMLSHLQGERLYAERTITGHGAERGGVRTILTNPSLSSSVDFIYFETLPWFMRPFVHTLRADLTNSSSATNEQIIKEMYYRPAIDRERGTQLELALSIPPASTVALTYDFEKAILRYTEYPPDANRGFNVAPAVIRILDQTQGQEDVYIRTTSLLLPLPTPDFSMPYNVIILTSTVMALAFGSLFNIIARRFVGADEVPSNFDVKKVRGSIRSKFLTFKDRFMSKSQKTE